MKALNRKERLRAQWIIGLLFAPLILITAVGATVHYKILALQVGDLEDKEAGYNRMFEAQAKKGELMEDLVRGLKDLRDSTKTMVVHQNAQRTIREDLMKMWAIQPVVMDTQSVNIDQLPAIYDSLGNDIVLIQSVRDSIAACDVEINNYKFQLDQCLDALKKSLEEKRKAGK